MNTGNPVMVEVTRGAIVESRHSGAAAIVRADESVVAAWGDVERPVFPRSTVKPLQALPLLETGAADRLHVGDRELALACASHNGEEEHVATVAAWLDRLELGPHDLVCGAHPPMSAQAAESLVRTGEAPSPLHNNCSGKHAGFLTTAIFLREPTTGYGGSSHPVQLRVRQVLSQFAAVEFRDDMIAVDGCSVPTFAMPLRSLALCMARLADPSRFGRLRTEAIRRILAAMAAHPTLVAGRGRFDTMVLTAAGGAVVVKGGAEGVQCAVLPELGLGIALKIDDGGKRAAETAMAGLLLAFAKPAEKLRWALLPYLDLPLRNAAGTRVGATRVAPDWLS